MLARYRIPLMKLQSTQFSEKEQTVWWHSSPIFFENSTRILGRDCKRRETWVDINYQVWRTSPIIKVVQRRDCHLTRCVEATFCWATFHVHSAREPSKWALQIKLYMFRDCDVGHNCFYSMMSHEHQVHLTQFYARSMWVEYLVRGNSIKSSELWWVLEILWLPNSGLGSFTFRYSGKWTCHLKLQLSSKKVQDTKIWPRIKLSPVSSAWVTSLRYSSSLFDVTMHSPEPMTCSTLYNICRKIVY